MGSITSLIQAAGTVLIGVVGLLLANSYARQVKIRLVDRLVEAYSRLWEATEVASVGSRGLDRQQRESLYEAMRAWYFKHGDGMFLYPRTRDLYLAVRNNLVCDIADVLPGPLRDSLAALADDDAERRRGCIATRQISLLRTQMKFDLSIYWDFHNYRRIRSDDRALLRSCDISPGRTRWSRPVAHRRVESLAHPCVCGLC
jgi:hypothetical protein